MLYYIFHLGMAVLGFELKLPCYRTLPGAEGVCIGPKNSADDEDWGELPLFQGCNISDITPKSFAHCYKCLLFSAVECTDDFRLKLCFALSVFFTDQPCEG
jgi:hypothetical protein